MRPPFVLLTGFAPFGARRRNESGMAVQAVRRRVRGADVVVRILPVSWARALPALRRDLSDPGLRAVVLCGEAARRRDVSVEVRARNRCARLADEDGRRPRSDRLAANAPAQRAATWSARSLVAVLRRAGARAVVSRDAGTFLCNAILFRVLGHADVRRRGVPVTFVHLPIPGHGAREGTTPAALSVAVGAILAEAKRRFLPPRAVEAPGLPRARAPGAPKTVRALRASPARRARAPRRGSRRA